MSPTQFAQEQANLVARWGANPAELSRRMAELAAVYQDPAYVPPEPEEEGAEEEEDGTLIRGGLATRPVRKDAGGVQEMVSNVVSAVPIFGPALSMITKLLPFHKKKKRAPAPVAPLPLQAASSKEEEEEEEEEDSNPEDYEMEYIQDGDNVVLRSPEFKHFAFLPQLAAAAGESALNWLGNKAMSLFSPKKEEEEEGGDEEEDAVCDAANFNAMDIEYDEEDGSVSLYLPQVANMDEASRNKFVGHVVGDFMGLFSNLLGKGADVVSSYLTSRGRGAAPAALPPPPHASGGSNESVSEEEEEEDGPSRRNRFNLRFTRRVPSRSRHRSVHGADLGNVRDAANGR